VELPGPHPGIPEDFNRRSLPIIETDRVWLRSHAAAYEPRHFGRSGANRFDAPAGEFGVLYVAADAHGAFIETFGREHGRMLLSLRDDLGTRAIAEVSSTRPLRLVDLSGAGLARIGADSRLASGSYTISQPWALALHEHPDTPDGLLFRSRHDPSRLCAAIFERASEILSFTRIGSWTDEHHAITLGAILDTYRYGLID
jgi:hypothetical protein